MQCETFFGLQLYQELTYVNRVYEYGVSEDDILKLYRLGIDYQLKYDGNPSMYTIAKAMFDYYESMKCNVDEFIEKASKWDFFEFVNDEISM